MTSEERFRASFNDAAVGLAHLAINGQFLEANPRLCAITGYTRPELLARRVQDLWPPEEVDHDIEQRRAVLSGELATYQRRKRYVRKDGGRVWVAAHRLDGA
jgi:PAS domain S-box-containing protein